MFFQHYCLSCRAARMPCYELRSNSCFNSGSLLLQQRWRLQVKVNQNAERGRQFFPNFMMQRSSYSGGFGGASCRHFFMTAKPVTSPFLLLQFLMPHTSHLHLGGWLLSHFRPGALTLAKPLWLLCWGLGFFAPVNFREGSIAIRFFGVRMVDDLYGGHPFPELVNGQTGKP